MAKTLNSKVRAKKPSIDIKNAKSLTLDEIEKKMEEIVCSNTDDLTVAIANEKTMSMLEKIANFKLKRLQLKELEKPQDEKKAEPITIKFVNSQDEEQKKRLEQIDKAVLENKNITPNA